jgi:hypothetical protein
VNARLWLALTLAWSLATIALNIGLGLKLETYLLGVALTVAASFNAHLMWCTSSAVDRAKTSFHRELIEAKLEAKFGLWRMYESRSWKHGPGVKGFNEVGQPISLKSSKPVCGSSALTAMKEAMQERFPLTYIHTSRPAVILAFWERERERVRTRRTQPCLPEPLTGQRRHATQHLWSSHRVDGVDTGVPPHIRQRLQQPCCRQSEERKKSHAMSKHGSTTARCRSLPLLPRNAGS